MKDLRGLKDWTIHDVQGVAGLSNVLLNVLNFLGNRLKRPYALFPLDRPTFGTIFCRWTNHLQHTGPGDRRFPTRWHGKAVGCISRRCRYHFFQMTTAVWYSSRFKNNSFTEM